MKKNILCCASIFLVFTSFCMDIKGGEQEKKSLGLVLLDVFPSGSPYSIVRRSVGSYFSGEINVVHLEKGNRITATFQPPEYLEQNQYPRLSSDKNFLLILTATWSLFYNPIPTSYEWVLFDLKAEKTIATFPKESNPRFETINNEEIVKYMDSEKGTTSFALPKEEETQSFLSSLAGRIQSYVSGVFTKEPIKKSDQPQAVKPKTVTRQLRAAPAAVPSVPKFMDEHKQNQLKEPLNSADLPPTPISTSEAFTSEKQPVSMQPVTERSLVLLPVAQEPLTLSSWQKNSFSSLIPIAFQSMQQQNKYIQLLPVYKTLYGNEIKQHIPAGMWPTDMSYQSALKLLQEIDEQSSQMSTKDDMEVVNSPAMIQDLVQKIILLSAVALELPLEQQRQLIQKMLALIQKYHTLYKSILNEMNTTKKTTLLRDTQPLATQAYALCKKIETLSLELQNETTDSLQGVQKIYVSVKALDELYVKLPPQLQQNILSKQKEIQKTYALTYKKALKANIDNRWKQYSTTIMNVASGTCAAAVTSALWSVVSQNAQLVLGSAVTFDTNKLIIGASIAVLASVTTQLTEAKLGPSVTALLSGGGSTAIAETAIIPYLQSTALTSYALQVPSFVGPIQAALTWEALGLVSSIIEQQGGISEIIQKINFKNMLLRSSQPASNEVTAFLLPKIETMVQNQQISFVITDIGWKVFTASVIGAGMYAAGISSVEGATLLEAIYYASLEEVKKGLAASLITAATKKTGALITIPSALALPAAEVVNAFYQGTDIVVNAQSAIPALIQTTAQVAIDFIVDESGGFKNILKNAASAIKERAQSRWSGIYGGLSHFVQTMFETETGTEESFGYGSV